ncbi:MAG: NUDIX domain-containing protein [Anaerolineae bacterium]|nr:NUDIX domain-containing protein [Anaerolineae bacterium]
MGITAAHTGDEFLGFFPGAEPFTLPDHPDLPIVFSCVIARHQGKPLFVYNAWRKGWELPAGMIERGESPYDAAVRELGEETGQVAPALTFAGMCLLRLKRGGLELGSLRSFATNEETSQMMLWDRTQRVDGYVDEISRELCRLVI